MTIYSVYDQLAEMISKLDAPKLASLKATQEMQSRLEFLIEKSKENQLPKKEKDELDHYIVLERLIRLSKIRSQEKLN